VIEEVTIRDIWGRFHIKRGDIKLFFLSLLYHTHALNSHA